MVTDLENRNRAGSFNPSLSLVRLYSADKRTLLESIFGGTLDSFVVFRYMIHFPLCGLMVVLWFVLGLH